MTEQAPGRVMASAPWSVRLFGDLQESFALPCVTAALDIPTMVGAIARGDDRICVNVHNLPEAGTLDPDSKGDNRPPLPALRAVLRALDERGIALDRGFDFHVHTRIPLVERALSGPVMVSAWTVALLALAGRVRAFSGNETAELACSALKGAARARGTADVYGCIMGGALFARFDEKPEVLPLERELPGFVLCHASPAAGGKERVPGAISATRAAVDSMKGLKEDFDLAETALDDALPLLRKLDDRKAGMLYAHLMNRDLCARAYEMLRRKMGMDDDRLGEMLDDAHEMLRDYLGFGLPELEPLIDAAKEGGALGCKIVPDSASFIAFAPDCAEAAAKAVRKAGGKALIVPISPGMHVQ